MSEVISITVRIMPKGDELDVELPVYSTGRQIADELLDSNVAARHDPEGNPLVYELISKAGNVRIEDDKSLHDLGIRDGETLYLVPKMVAG